MMRAMGMSVLVLSASLAASSASASTMAFEDNKLNFKSCDGVATTARWRGSEFSLAEPGKSLGDGHASFKHLAWDGSCQTVSWDADGAKFLIARDDAGAPADLVRYIAPDGSKWAGMRAGDGFFVTRIADQDEEVSASKLKAIAEWLTRTNKEFTPGSEFAEQLRATVVE